MTTPHTYTISSTANLLSRLGIQFGYQALKEDLETRPDYPSAFSFHHLRGNYVIPSQVVQAATFSSFKLFKSYGQ